MCRWATAAPAFQQAYTSSAISAGVMGTLGLFSLVGQAPVVATVMMVLFFRSPWNSNPFRMMNTAERRATARRYFAVG